MSQLSCKGVSVVFGGVTACNRVSLEVEKGKIVGLIGPNGAGKTTLFNVLTRFQEQNEGSVSFGGKNYDKLRAHHISNIGISRTFQNINLCNDQSTLDNILIGAHRRTSHPLASILSLKSARKKERDLLQQAIEVAQVLGIDDELDSLVCNLPYGVQKRVEIARALMSRPKVLLLDEPVAGCNEEETSEIKQIIRWANKEYGITIFLVEHDMAMVMEVCDYIYVVNFGSNLAGGTPAEIQANPEVIAAYLGEEE